MGFLLPVTAEPGGLTSESWCLPERAFHSWSYKRCEFTLQRKPPPPHLLGARREGVWAGGPRRCQCTCRAGLCISSRACGGRLGHVQTALGGRPRSAEDTAAGEVAGFPCPALKPLPFPARDSADHLGISSANWDYSPVVWLGTAETSCEHRAWRWRFQQRSLTEVTSWDCVHHLVRPSSSPQKHQGSDTEVQLAVDLLG